MEGPERWRLDMSDVENRMTRYLLGELSPEEVLQVENEYFRDEKYFESIQALEDQLLRDFVRDEMDSDLRRRFEARYRSSPELEEKIEFARAVLSSLNILAEERRGVAATASRRPRFSLRDFFNFRLSVFQYVTAALAVLGIGVGYFAWMRNARLESDLAQLRQEKTAVAQEKTALERALSERRQEPPIVASFILVAGVSRDQDVSNVLAAPTAVGRVQFTLPLPEAIKYSGYQAVLQRGGAQVFSQELPRDALINSGKAVVVSLPSMSLRPGRYILYVTGRHESGPYQTVQYYAFSVKE